MQNWMFEIWSSNVLPRFRTNTIIRIAKTIATHPSASPATPIPMPPAPVRARPIAIAPSTIAAAPRTNPNTTVNDRTTPTIPTISAATASPPVEGAGGGATGITGGTGDVDARSLAGSNPAGGMLVTACAISRPQWGHVLTPSSIASPQCGHVPAMPEFYHPQGAQPGTLRASDRADAIDYVDRRPERRGHGRDPLEDLRRDRRSGNARNAAARDRLGLAEIHGMHADGVDARGSDHELRLDRPEHPGIGE